MSKHSFRLSSDAESNRQKIFDKYRLVSENKTENWDKFFIDIAPKSLLDNSSPAPLSPSGEQSPTVETETDSPLTVAQENPCRYRTVLNVKGNAIDTQVICAETDKLPLAACNTRHKRYADNGDQCQPLKNERLMLKTVKLQRQQPTTQPFKSNVQERGLARLEGVLPRFYCPDGHTATFCHGGNSCNRRLTCPEMNRQPSR